MAINETIQIGKKYRVLIDSTNGYEKWNRYSFWTHASDVEFDDGETLESKLIGLKGVTTDENGTMGLAADVTLVKKIKNQLMNLIKDLENAIRDVNKRLGGLRFYEDSNGKWVVGADSVPKKLGNMYSIKKIILTDDANDWWSPININNEYEVITKASPDEANIDTYYLGIYNEVYIHIEEITASKYDRIIYTENSGTSSEKLWRDSMKAIYDINSGNIRIDYGKSLYQGGGNACRMTILYC